MASPSTASIPDTLRLLNSVRDVILESMKDSRKATEPQIIVAFSGGKDSWAAIDLVHRVFKKGNVHVYNLFTVPNLECELREIRRVERRYDLKVHRLPGPSLAASLRGGLLQPVSTAFRRKYRHADVYRIVRNITGAEWIAFGHRMDESLQRRGMIKTAQGLLEKDRKVFPLWNWKKQDVYRYLSTVGISAPEQFTEDDTTGFTLGPQTLLYLKRNYPSDYAKVLQMFPLAEVQFHREMMRLDAGLKCSNNSINKRKDLRETLDDYRRQQENRITDSEGETSVESGSGDEGVARAGASCIGSDCHEN